MSSFEKQNGFTKTVTIKLHGLKTYYLKEPVLSEFLNATVRYAKIEVLSSVPKI